MTNPITVTTFTFPQEAYIIKARLESEGMEVFLQDELIVQMHNFYSNAVGGVKLQVDGEANYHRAIEILQESGIINTDLEESSTWVTQIDATTSNWPVVKNYPLEIRILAMTALLIFVILSFVFYA